MTTHKALQNKKVLFKTMFGSRLYGTNTPQSDIDWKEVFLPEMPGLLVGRKPTNVVISTGGDKTRNTKDDVDYEYIPIQVFANDFIGGQTYAVEMAFAVLGFEQHAGQVVQELSFYEFTRQLTRKFLTSNIKAMIGYAMNQAQVYGIKGTRLASVRKFTDQLNHVLDSGELTTMDSLACMEEWVKANEDKYLFMSTYENNGKKFGAVSVLEKLYPLTITLGEAYDRTTALKGKYGSRAQDAESAKGVDWKATSHAVRITMQAIRTLRDHDLVFPLPKEEVELLLDIKHGKKTFDEVEEILTKLFEELDQVKETTTLPAKDAKLEYEFEQWLKGWMMYFYGQSDDYPFFESDEVETTYYP
jgi:hypothetical protein